MVGPNARRINEGPAEAEAQRPMVPERITVAAPQKPAEARDSAMREIRSTLDYSSHLPPISTSIDVENRLNVFRRSFARIEQTLIPALGERYKDILAPLDGYLDNAEASIKARNHAQANKDLDRFNAMIPHAGELIDTHVLIVTMPPIRGVRHENRELTPSELQNALMDNAVVIFHDFGTANEQRAVNGLAAIRTLATNGERINAAGPAGAQEAGRMLGFVSRLANDSKQGKTYTPEQAAADRKTLRAFEADLDTLAIQTIARMQAVMGRMIADPFMLAQIKANLAQLNADLDDFFERFSKKKEDERISDEEFGKLAKRYYALTQDVPPQTDAERGADIESTARMIVGKAAKIKEGSPEWFAQIALSAVGEGNMGAASVALAIAQLELAHKGAAAQLPEEITASIKTADFRKKITPAIADAWRGAIAAEAGFSDIDDLEKMFSGKGVGANKRGVAVVLDGARTAEQRINAGDAEGGLRLISMMKIYASLMSASKWGQFPARSAMEDAMTQEILHGNAGTLFAIAQTRNELGARTAAMRDSLSRWKGLERERKFMGSMLKRVDEFSNGNRFTEASALFENLSIYAMAISHISHVDRSGHAAIPKGFDMGVMERPLEAMSKAKDEAELRQAVASFAAGYQNALSQFTQSEYQRLDSLGKELGASGMEIVSALAVAKKRSDAKDFQGALTLLGYISNYFGAPSEKDKEGWRYQVLKSAPYHEANRMFVDSIQMEANALPGAPPDAAASAFRNALETQAKTGAMVEESGRVRLWFEGRETLRPLPKTPARSDAERKQYEAISQTKGRAVVALSDGKSHLMDWNAITRYEATHAAEPGLNGKMYLRDLVKQMEVSGGRGDLKGYESARKEFFARASLISERVIEAARAASVGTAVTRLDQMENALLGLGKLYGLPLLPHSSYETLKEVVKNKKEVTVALPLLGSLVVGGGPGGPGTKKMSGAELLERIENRYGQVIWLGKEKPQLTSQMLEQLSALDIRVSNLWQQISALRKEADQLKAQGTSVKADDAKTLETKMRSLTTELENERRTATGYRLVANQMLGNERYKRSAAMMEKDGKTPTINILERSNDMMRDALSQILNGDFDKALYSYRAAMVEREGVLASYRAFQLIQKPDSRISDNYPTLPVFMKHLYSDKARLPGFDKALTEARDELSSYSSMHANALEAVLKGDDERNVPWTDSASNRIARTNVIDSGLLSPISADDSEWLVFAALRPQSGMGSLAWTASVQGVMQSATSKAQEATQKQALAWNAAAVVASPFAPELSFTMFGLGMYRDAMDEFNITSRLAPETWMMVGLMAATAGLGGASKLFGAAGTARIASGELPAIRTGMLELRAARGLATAETVIGSVFMEQMVIGGLQRLQEGDTMGGLAELGMAFFPFAVHGMRSGTSYNARPIEMPKSIPGEPALAEQIAAMRIDWSPTRYAGAEPMRAIEGAEPAATVVDLPAILSDSQSANGNMRAFGRESLIDLLGKLGRNDESGRAAQESLLAYPPNVRNFLIELAKRPEIKASIARGELDPLAERMINASIPIISNNLNNAGVPQTSLGEAQVLGRQDRNGDHTQLTNLLRAMLDPNATNAARMGARLRIERIRSVSPYIGAEIDEMLHSESGKPLRDAVLSGKPEGQWNETARNSLRMSADMIGKETGDLAASAMKPGLYAVPIPVQPGMVPEAMKPGLGPEAMKPGLGPEAMKPGLAPLSFTLVGGEFREGQVISGREALNGMHDDVLRDLQSRLPKNTADAIGRLIDSRKSAEARNATKEAKDRYQSELASCAKMLQDVVGFRIEVVRRKAAGAGERPEYEVVADIKTKERTVSMAEEEKGRGPQAPPAPAEPQVLPSEVKGPPREPRWPTKMVTGLGDKIKYKSPKKEQGAKVPEEYTAASNKSYEKGTRDFDRILRSIKPPVEGVIQDEAAVKNAADLILELYAKSRSASTPKSERSKYTDIIYKLLNQYPNLYKNLVVLSSRPEYMGREEYQTVHGRPTLTGERAIPMQLKGEKGTNGIGQPGIDIKFPDAQRGVLYSLMDTILGRVDYAHAVASGMPRGRAAQQAKAQMAPTAERGESALNPLNPQDLGVIVSVLESNSPHVSNVENILANIESIFGSSAKRIQDLSHSVRAFDPRLSARDRTVAQNNADAVKQATVLVEQADAYVAKMPDGTAEKTQAQAEVNKARADIDRASHLTDQNQVANALLDAQDKLDSAHGIVLSAMDPTVNSAFLKRSSELVGFNPETPAHKAALMRVNEGLVSGNYILNIYDITHSGFQGDVRDVKTADNSAARSIQDYMLNMPRLTSHATAREAVEASVREAFRPVFERLKPQIDAINKDMEKRLTPERYADSRIDLQGKFDESLKGKSISEMMQILENIRTKGYEDPNLDQATLDRVNSALKKENPQFDSAQKVLKKISGRTNLDNDFAVLKTLQEPADAAKGKRAEERLKAEADARRRAKGYYRFPDVVSRFTEPVQDYLAEKKNDMGPKRYWRLVTLTSLASVAVIAGTPTAYFVKKYATALQEERAGRDPIFRDFGTAASDKISKDDARYLGTNGKGITEALSAYKLPPKSQFEKIVYPADIDDFDRKLHDFGTKYYIDPRKMEPLIKDAIGLSKKLEAINTNLQIFSDTSKSDTDRATAKAGIELAIAPYGLAFDKVKERYDKQDKKPLMDDSVVDLLIPRWKANGSVVTLAFFMAEAFCKDTGLDVSTWATRLSKPENADLFRFAWGNWNTRNIPASTVKQALEWVWGANLDKARHDAMDTLAPGPGRTKFEDTIANGLRAAGLYFTASMEESSMLRVLDTLSVDRPELRPLFNALRANNSEMEDWIDLNKFELKESETLFIKKTTREVKDIPSLDAFLSAKGQTVFELDTIIRALDLPSREARLADTQLSAALKAMGISDLDSGSLKKEAMERFRSIGFEMDDKLLVSTINSSKAKLHELSIVISALRKPDRETRAEGKSGDELERIGIRGDDLETGKLKENALARCKELLMSLNGLDEIVYIVHAKQDTLDNLNTVMKALGKTQEQLDDDEKMKEALNTIGITDHANSNLRQQAESMCRTLGISFAEMDAYLVGINKGRFSGELTIEDVARIRGFIGPAALAEISPLVYSEPELVKFVMEKSNFGAAAGKEGGLLGWISASKDHIVGENFVKLLRYAQDNMNDKSMEEIGPSMEGRWNTLVKLGYLTARTKSEEKTGNTNAPDLASIIHRTSGQRPGGRLRQTEEVNRRIVEEALGGLIDEGLEPYYTKKEFEGHIGRMTLFPNKETGHKALVERIAHILTSDSKNERAELESLGIKVTMSGGIAIIEKGDIKEGQFKAAIPDYLDKLANLGVDKQVDAQYKKKDKEGLSVEDRVTGVLIADVFTDKGRKAALSKLYKGLADKDPKKAAKEQKRVEADVLKWTTRLCKVALKEKPDSVPAKMLAEIGFNIGVDNEGKVKIDFDREKFLGSPETIIHLNEWALAEGRKVKAPKPQGGAGPKARAPLRHGPR